MKREIYSLANEELALLIGNLHQSLVDEKIPYIIVGGVATQAHILSRLQKKTGKTLSELCEDPSLRLQDFVRATDDVDLAIDPKIEDEIGRIETGKKIGGVLKKIDGKECIPPSQEHILRYHLARHGIKRPIFQISRDGEIDYDRAISFNIGLNRSDLEGLDPQFYDLFIEEGQELKMPFDDNYNLVARVIRPEHLLACKTAKFRAKDTMDLHNLADIMRESGENIDLDEMKKILLPNYVDNYHRFLDLAKLEDTSQ